MSIGSGREAGRPAGRRSATYRGQRTRDVEERAHVPGHAGPDRRTSSFYSGFGRATDRARERERPVDPELEKADAVAAARVG